MSSDALATRPIPDPEQEAAVRSSRRSDPANTPSSTSAIERELSHGDFVGRYSVLSRLGRGGMGVVYKAYDPQLDRNVALKLLRRGRSSIEADLQLMREAQTLARLQHPNIVAVYDAGLASHGVFIAMELLEGCTLSAWLEDGYRTVDSILDVFRAAGAGLVAAHGAGFLHRDFKPGNVFVGDDGSIKVLDFGIAHAFDGQPASVLCCPSSAVQSGSRIDGAARPGSVVASRISGDDEIREVVAEAPRDAALVGTPAYMAPEELRGVTDPRSDQFSLCMSLYVALYDRAPCFGETYEERLESLDRGRQLDEAQIDRAATGERVPPRVRRLLRRGLSVDPADRFGTMPELLAELAEPPRRWPPALALTTLLVGFSVGAAVFDGSGREPCRDPAAALAGVWGSDDRASVRSAFERHDGPSLAGALDRVHGALDGYASDWAAQYETSCRATFVTHQQSAPLFDHRMRCLQRRRNRLQATIEGLAEAESERQLLERLVLPFKLPPVRDCADLDALMDEQPLPDDPDVRAEIVTLRRRIDFAYTRFEAHDIAGGLEVVVPVVERARTVGYAPLLAEALLVEGKLEASGDAADRAEATLAEAVEVAAAAGDERSEAAAWISLLFSITRRHDRAQGIAIALGARSAVERADDAVLRAWLLNNLGVFHAAYDEGEAARGYLEQAIAAKVEALGEGDLDVGISWVNLGNMLVDQHAPAEAREAFDRAGAIFDATVGRTHPLASYVVSGRCRVELEQGHADAAVALCTEAMRSFAQWPPSPTWLGRMGFNLARAQWKTGDRGPARATALRARAEIEGEDPTIVEEIDLWLEDPDDYDRTLELADRDEDGEQDDDEPPCTEPRSPVPWGAEPGD